MTMEWGAFQYEPRYTEEELRARREACELQHPQANNGDDEEAAAQGNRRDRELQDRLEYFRS